MRRCKLCRLRGVCNELPVYCLLLNYVSIVILIGTLGYLFVTGIEA